MTSISISQSLLTRRHVLGGLGLAGVIALAGPARVLADHGAATGAVRSDPWLAANPYDGSLYLTWVGPDQAEHAHAEEADATPGADHESGTAATNRVYLARSTDNGATFGEPVLVSGDDAYVSIGATPAVTGFGPDGSVYVAYLSAEPHELSEWGREIVRVARSEDGTIFAPAIETPQDDGITNAGGYHDIIVDEAGRVYVAWLDFRDTFNAGTGDFSSSSLRVAWSDDGARSFSPSVEVSKPACPCCPPSFQFGADGRLYLAWRDQWDQADGSDPVRDPVVAWSDDRGATWSAAELVHRDGWHMPQCPHSGPGFDLDAAGRLHIAWFTGAEGRNGVFYAVAEAAGEAFSAPLALLEDDWAPVTPVRLALDDGGNAYVAFVDAREETPLLILNRITPDGMVSPVGPEGLNGVYPTLAVAGNDLSLGYIGEHDVQIDTIPLTGEMAEA
ncbi:MAG: exo-alpha-sialidase [Thermomicrobiales bacterium]|nr:exo-alpha-sialidase [Thermomicrobiales bacterium]